VVTRSQFQGFVNVVPFALFLATFDVK